MKGFNVGVIVSLGDMELALDYLNDEASFEPDIDIYKRERMAVKNSSDNQCLTGQEEPILEIEEDEEDFDIDALVGDSLAEEDEDNLDSLIDEAMGEDDDDEDSSEDVLDIDEDIDAESETDEIDIDEDGVESETDEIDIDEDEDGVESDEIEIDIDEDELGYDNDTEEESGAEEENEADSDDEDKEFDLDELADSVINTKTEAETELEHKLAQAKALVEQREAEQRRHEEQEKLKSARERALKAQKEAEQRKHEEQVNQKKQAEIKKTDREQELERQLQEALAKLERLESIAPKSTEVLRPAPKQAVKPIQKPGEAEHQHTKKQELHKPDIIRVEEDGTAQVTKRQVAQHTRPVLTNEQAYAAMDIKALYIEVKKFLDEMGVSKSAVDRSTVDKEFGVSNVNRLIMQSYLISLGKRITVGK